ncbi:TPA: glycosyltransferase family 2 protein [Vibrio vulnificus]
MTIKFSVVVPYFNDIEFIEQCLDSVMNQTYSSFEVIVVDDCSDDSDKLKSLIENKYRKKIHIKYVRNKINSNGAYSRNIGVSLADGDYVCFLDADDYWVEHKLKRVHDTIILNKLGNNDVIYSKVRILANDTSMVTRPERGITKSTHVCEYLFLGGGFMQTSTLVVPRKVAKKLSFDVRFKRHQDYQYCIQLGLSVNFYFIDEALTIYRAKNGIYSKKLEDLDYCKYWLHEMSPLMTKNGYFGYLLFPYNARLINSKKYFYSLKNTFNCLLNINFKGYILACRKLKSVLSSYKVW